MMNRYLHTLKGEGEVKVLDAHVYIPHHLHQSSVASSDSSYSRLHLHHKYNHIEPPQEQDFDRLLHSSTHTLIQDNGNDLKEEGGDDFVEIDDMLLDELDLEELDLSGLLRRLNLLRQLLRPATTVTIAQALLWKFCSKHQFDNRVPVSEEKLVLWLQAIVLQLYMPTKSTRKRRDVTPGRVAYGQIEQLAKELEMPSAMLTDRQGRGGRSGQGFHCANMKPLLDRTWSDKEAFGDPLRQPDRRL
ncbi:hypothetical protein V8E54_015013 [Elaphomyces granulatus]